MNRTTNVIGAILLLLVGFVALNMIAGLGLRGARIDATQGRLYTLTAGSRNIARQSDEPIKLTFYYSAKLASNNGQINSYAMRVRELLEEFARASSDKIQLTVIDPRPFTDAEDQAQAAGITPIPFTASDSLYFGVTGTNSADGKEVIPFFNPADEKLLEYTVSKMVYSLANTRKKNVGLLSTLDIEGGFSMDPQTRQPKRTPPWRVAADLKQTMNVSNIAKDAKEIPADLSLLVVIHPKDLPQHTLYAIDQYIMKGGKAIFFVDPSCNADPEGGNPMMGQGGSNASDLNFLLNAWGVQITPAKFVADITTGITVPQGQMLQILGLKEENLSREDPVTASLARVNFGTAGAISAFITPTPAPDPANPAKAAPAQPGPRLTIVPLAQSSDKAALTDVAALMVPDPKALIRNYIPGTLPITLAARLSGNITSAFPGGRPPVEGESAEDKTRFSADFTPATKEPANLLLFADVDLLSNMFWVRESEPIPGLPMVQKFADNGDLFLSAVDNMGGSNDLLTVRARQESARPFTLVEDMQRRANERYRQEEQMLEKELEVTQQKINELQARKQGGDAFVLTPEQQKEVENFQKQAIDTRKKLRAVKSNLRQDIESLGTKLKFINIGLIPVLVTIAALGLGFYRVSRRRSAAARPL